MKRITALLLALVMLLSMTACGGSAPAETEAPAAAPVTEAVTEPTAEPITEPTLSPEEILYNSLPDRLKQAVDVGIVELSQLENPDREVTIAEAAQMLQNAYTRRHGVESKLMADVLALDVASEPAYLGWIGRLPIAMYVEALEPENYENYDQWLNYVITLSQGYDLSTVVTTPLRAEGYSYWDGDDVFVRNAYGWFDIGWKSGMDAYFFRDMPEGNALLDSCVGQGNLLAYTSYLYDQTTGHKLLEVSLHDEVEVEQIMTVGTMAEMALRTYHSFWQDLEMTAYEDCVAADSAILTAELLSRETTLPDANCTSLPAQWHGVTLNEVGWITNIGEGCEAQHTDPEILEYEIQEIQNAGFNYIGLQLDFSWLQGREYYTTQTYTDGQLSAVRLKKVDQILAWCMERDVHLDIRCTGVGGLIPEKQSRWTATDENAKKFAEIWSVLAQRYAEVPNEYLSFTVMDSFLTRYGKDGVLAVAVDRLGPKQKDLVAFVKPSVEAIREATPDRCIILDLSGNNVGTAVLELGVALSADLASITDEFFEISEKNVLNPDWYQTVQWPYKGTVDAESLLHENQYWADDSTVIRVMELAQENGLGFMFSGWGKLVNQYRGSYFCAARYPDETYQAFITDMTDTMESYGYGWCYEEWYGHSGITFCAPITKNVTYEQIGEYPMYYDTAMLGFFKEVNGVQ